MFRESRFGVRKPRSSQDRLKQQIQVCALDVDVSAFAFSGRMGRSWIRNRPTEAASYSDSEGTRKANLASFLLGGPWLTVLRARSIPSS